jgi:CubicO group peptidase (beta-lactamase class C family)
MESEFMQQLAQVVNRERMRWNVPGIAVGILRDGKIEKAGFGVTSLETGCPVTPDTLFEIGSNSKVFSTTALMTLVDEGKIDLNEQVTTYLPDLRLQDPELQQRIKVGHLVSHQSGIWGDVFDDHGWGDDALAKSVAALPNVPHIYEPTELWSYTNVAFNIAGRIIEVLTGKTFEDAVRERVLEPLGLNRTFYFAHEVFPYPHAVGHRPDKPGDDDVIVAREYWLNRALASAGGLHSTVEDVLNFDRFHVGAGGPQIISENSRIAMQQPQIRAANFADEWCLGWWTRTVDGATIIEHGGGTNGFITRNTTIPEKQMAFAVFTNSAYGEAAIQAILRWLFKTVAGLDETRPEAVTVPDADLERFAGDYANPMSSAEISVEDGGVRVQVRSTSITTDDEVVYPPVVYKPFDDLKFIATTGREAGANSQIDFILNEDGTIRFVRLGGRLAARQ